QSQNGTNSASDLQSIQDEITQRLSEVDRISQQTDFNGVKVLDGSKTSISIQVGSQDGQTISINLQKVNTDSLNLSGFNVDGPASSATTGVASGSTYNSITLSADATVTLSGTSSLTATGLVSDSNGNYFVSGTLTADVEGVGASGAAAYYKLTSNDISITEDGAMTVTVDASDNNLTGVATENPLTTLDKALSTVDDMRSNLGAIQNRFDSTINNLTSTSTNLSEAQSRIQDADYATEVSNMSKAQILQQAGTSVLAQANQVPQTVLSLLQ
ncbi:flagellin, partial [Lonsdalea populi]